MIAISSSSPSSRCTRKSGLASGSVTALPARSNKRVVSVSDLSRCSDEELLVRGARDAEAFGVLYDRYEDPLLGFLRRASGSADLAADLTA